VGHGERTAPGGLIGPGKIVPMRLNLKIEELPMATSAELYQLSWIIEQLLADPRRIVQARSQMHLGQQVQYFNWPDGKLRPGQVVAMKDSRVTVLDTQTKRHVSLSFAGIVLEPATGSPATKDETFVPPPEIGRREDFRVGQRVSFTDADLQHRVGVIVRINQQTATVSCDGRNWRVSFPLLRHVIDA
jgi:hypothetical protein